MSIRPVRHLLRSALVLPFTALVLVAACAASALGRQAPAPPAAQGDYLYVCIQDDAQIAIIDMSSRSVVRTIDLTGLGFSANAKPHHIAVTPDGTHWFVSLIGENRVVRFDREGELAGHYAMEAPGMLAFDAERDLLVASRSMSAVNPPARVSVMHAESMEGEQIDVFFPRPHPMVLSDDGRWAYTGSLGVNQIAAIDLETEEVTLTTVEGPSHSFVQFDVSPDGRWLVASTELSGRLLVFDLSADAARPRLVHSIDVGPMAFDPIFAPDGATVWVPVKGANEVALIDTSDWTETHRITGESLLQPHAILFSPDGAHAFVSNNNKMDHMAAGHEGHGAMAGGNGNVTVIDAATREVVNVIQLGKNVTGMGARAAH